MLANRLYISLKQSSQLVSIEPDRVIFNGDRQFDFPVSRFEQD